MVCVEVRIHVRRMVPVVVIVMHSHFEVMTHRAVIIKIEWLAILRQFMVDDLLSHRRHWRHGGTCTHAAWARVRHMRVDMTRAVVSKSYDVLTLATITSLNRLLPEAILI